MIKDAGGLRKESNAAAAITPGQLLERASATTVQRHSVSGGDAQKMFAMEDDLQGKEISQDYATGNVVMFAYCLPGTEINAILENDTAAVSVGDPLMSAGNGNLRKHTAAASNSDGAFDEGGETVYSEPIVAWAMEALDLSDSSGADPASARIQVEVA